MGRLARLPAKADGKGRLAGIQRVLEGEAGSDAVQRQVAEGFGWKIDGENDQHSLKSGVSVKKWWIWSKPSTPKYLPGPMQHPEKLQEE